MASAANAAPITVTADARMAREQQPQSSNPSAGRYKNKLSLLTDVCQYPTWIKVGVVAKLPICSQKSFVDGLNCTVSAVSEKPPMPAYRHQTERLVPGCR